ncbi:Hsp20/alpha crystallin family protein [Luteibacter aegosomatis]|uniref:Hsp20/alpha crystallin family protein n=1 Tax=Luteibacter aegosomatis TaxID=2911537 RepID=UPI001FFBC391|nr:Hsp20/alpha crystallin family protein [Luteibacter aegosomatis]UPG83852.1 Hsp20/alpha crystallin family protein [Luteibacter aegosomatis]
MASMIRWNPLKTLSAIDRFPDVDDLFRSTFSRSSWGGADIAPDMRIDVTESDGSYKVKADLPGVDKKDIEVSINDNQVVISAEVRRETHQKEGERDIVTERSFGQAYRAFTLPAAVSSDKADARYEDGVLTLTLPKKENGSARKLKVS